MSETIFKYPLDLTGQAVGNRVVDEDHVIGSAQNRIFVPHYGPFFNNDKLVITDASNGRILEPEDDYLLVHYYREASNAAGQPIYAGIRIVNPAVSNTVTYSGQQMGGEYSYSYYALAQAIEAVNQSDLQINWGDLVGAPSRFPVSEHMHGPYSIYGLKYVVESLHEVAAAIRDGNLASRELLLTQIRDKFTEFDAFVNALTESYDQAANELSSI